MLGRDVYSRTVYGARVSLTVGLSVPLLSIALGLVIGLVTGFNRWVDAILMRVMDGLMAIPAVLIAIALMALTRASLRTSIFAITVAEVPRVARLVRGVVLTLRDCPLSRRPIASGTSLPRILWRHIVPNTVAPLLVQGTYVAASAMIVEAILSFLGAGTPPEHPELGQHHGRRAAACSRSPITSCCSPGVSVGHGAGDQPAGRRAARRARPAPRAADVAHGR